MPSTFDAGAVRRSAYCSGTLTLIATALAVALITINVTSEEHGCDMKQFTELNATCLRIDFKKQRENRFYDFTFDICDSMANLAAIPPVLALAEVYSTRSTAGKLMVPAFVAGTAITALQLTYRAGTHTAIDWVTGPDWDLSDEQIQDVAMMDLIAMSQNIWLFALDFLLEAIGMLCAAHLVYQHGFMPKGWAHLGVFGAFLGILSFFMEIGRFGSWRLMSAVGGITMGVLGFIVQPIWVVWLGCCIESAVNQSYRGSMIRDDDEEAGGGRHVEMGSGGAASATRV